MPIYWWICCKDCDYQGPRGRSEEDAIALHNGIAREEKWRRRDSELPLDHAECDVWCAIPMVEDGVFLRNYYVKVPFQDGVFWLNGRAIKHVTHWRPHTPPKPPEEP